MEGSYNQYLEIHGNGPRVELHFSFECTSPSVATHIDQELSNFTEYGYPGIKWSWDNNQTILDLDIVVRKSDHPETDAHYDYTTRLLEMLNWKSAYLKPIGMRLPQNASQINELT